MDLTTVQRCGAHATFADESSEQLCGRTCSAILLQMSARMLFPREDDPGAYPSVWLSSHHTLAVQTAQEETAGQKWAKPTAAVNGVLREGDSKEDVFIVIDFSFK